MKTHDVKTVRKLTRNHYSQHRMQLTAISEKKLHKHVRMRNDINQETGKDGSTDLIIR